MFAILAEKQGDGRVVPVCMCVWVWTWGGEVKDAVGVKRWLGYFSLAAEMKRARRWGASCGRSLCCRLASFLVRRHKDALTYRVG